MAAFAHAARELEEPKEKNQNRPDNIGRTRAYIPQGLEEKQESKERDNGRWHLVVRATATARASTPAANTAIGTAHASFFVHHLVHKK